MHPKLRVKFLGSVPAELVFAATTWCPTVRSRLNNLVMIVNCNYQRLDGPVRGNSKARSVDRRVRRVRFENRSENRVKTGSACSVDSILQKIEMALEARRLMNSDEF